MPGHGIKEEQLSRVLAAFESGSRTAPEVAVITGLLPKSCAAYARLLVARGLLIDRGAYRPMGRGRPTRWYQPASG